MKRAQLKLACLAVALCMMAKVAAGQELQPSQRPAERDVGPIGEWSCVFAGRDVSWRYAWGGQTRKVVLCEYQIRVGDRIISQGRTRTTLHADGDSGDYVALTIPMPPV